ncbi:hypothetical protein CROQUDRAFT_607295 [Cronartium quercuum f. sp. fusiforme G11]|uniref:Uncharacterized protein n=1 Tax=Cronartium quercuum f. sp. fusiforme G11 TaxID=708437 RepID=A0A9P6NDN5_9BASI|nr:hypothetical protein CROQUDRAFT_607295 [Cronartium quercuum f. sp. fusiforme G11]
MYLELQRKTLNWTSPESYKDVMLQCLKVDKPCITCTRMVDLIDLTSCQCKKLSSVHATPILSTFFILAIYLALLTILADIFYV